MLLPSWVFPIDISWRIFGYFLARDLDKQINMDYKNATLPHPRRHCCVACIIAEVISSVCRLRLIIYIPVVSKTAIKVVLLSLLSLSFNDQSGKGRFLRIHPRTNFSTSSIITLDKSPFSSRVLCISCRRVEGIIISTALSRRKGEVQKFICRSVAFISSCSRKANWLLSWGTVRNSLYEMEGSPGRLTCTSMRTLRIQRKLSRRSKNMKNLSINHGDWVQLFGAKCTIQNGRVLLIDSRLATPRLFFTPDKHVIYYYDICC